MTWVAIYQILALTLFSHWRLAWKKVLIIILIYSSQIKKNSIFSFFFFFFFLKIYFPLCYLSGLDP